MLANDEFLTVKETAARLGVSPNTIRAWGSVGKIPEYRHSLNNYRMFKVEDVEQLRKQIEKPVLRLVRKKAK